MINSWPDQSREEQILFNPSFCSILLWQAARGYASIDDAGISFEEMFIVLPMTLHGQMRESLPRSVRTSMPVWIERNPLAPRQVGIRAQMMVPVTKRSIMFGGTHGLLSIDDGKVLGGSGWAQKIIGIKNESTAEVKSCIKQAEFLGKWFASTGNKSTVFALLGVQI